MRSFPPLPDLIASDSTDDVLRGHLWLLELIDGTGLRFRMDDSGLLRFGDPDATYADLEDAPLALRPAIRHVRARFDREALRASVDDPAAVVFFGVATHRRRIDYDWQRLPPFLGTDVWTASSGETGTPPTPAGGTDAPVARFVRPTPPRRYSRASVSIRSPPSSASGTPATSTPRRYRIPDSAWYDGPAAGVVVRN